MKIKDLITREVLDSRGDPTVEVEILTQTGIRSIASVPSGASVGSHEALELRDNNPNRLGGMGVLKAIDNINNKILPAIKDIEYLRIKDLDKTLIELDGTEHKSNIGANAILAVSIAATKVLATEKNMPFYKYISEVAENDQLKMPFAMFNFIEGAKHANNNLKIQEFLVVVDGNTFKERLVSASECFHRLKKIQTDQKIQISYGDEGGYAPNLRNDEEALKLIVASGKFKLALDMAGIEPEDLQIDYIAQKYPIISLEDPRGESDWNGWSQLNQKYANQFLIVGDDLLATNLTLLQQAISKNAISGVIVKPNQVGTVSETIDFVLSAKKANLKTIVSHRSGESEDTFIADFAVGVGVDYVKFGAPSRGERVAKYNRLLRIEEGLNG